MSVQKKIFISYSWDSLKHKAWVKKFSDDLQARLGEGFKVLLDQYLTKGSSYSRFMKLGLKEADKVLIIGTPKYKEKSEASGGVAYETMVITNVMISDMNTTKFYPILRSGTFETSFPTDIKDRIGDDFSDDKKYKENLQIVVDALIEELDPQDKHASDTIVQTIEQLDSSVKSGMQNVKEKQINNTLVFTVGKVSFKMIRVEGGSFMMGASANDTAAEDCERPAHQVKVSSYYIGETVVTQSLWKEVMKVEHPSKYKGPNRPVECVSWYDCQEFIEKLNITLCKNFRLPTEAEWEYAARGGNGKSNYKYSGSNNIEEVAWHDKNAYLKGVSSPDYGTHDVKKLKSNTLGLYDMSGNVWEWCSDWYGEKYYSNSILSNPLGPVNGQNRVRRGGCWASYEWRCRVSYRRSAAPVVNDGGIGFRLALSE